MNTDYKYSEIIEETIRAVYKVYNALGSRFLEKVYENPLIIELKKSELEVKQKENIRSVNICGDQCLN